jgi:L-cysteine S-thiosulfotransferase
VTVRRLLRFYPWGLGFAFLSLSPHGLATTRYAPYQVTGDAIMTPLTMEPASAQRGRAIVIDRQRGMCLLCHSGPFPEEKTPGNVSTDLSHVATRWTAGQLRLRVVDSRLLHPQTPMPAFHAPRGGDRLPARWQGKPLLSAQEVEDVVAFLVTLR